MKKDRTTPLSDISDVDLELELQRRKEAQRLDELTAHNAQCERTFQNLDALLLLVPNHSRTSCDDNNFRNNAIRARCTRCVLLEAEANGDWRNDMKLVITVEHDESHASY